MLADDAKHTFQLDCIHVSLLHDANSIPDCILRGSLITAKRQISYQEWPARTSIEPRSLRVHPMHGKLYCLHLLDCFETFPARNE